MESLGLWKIKLDTNFKIRIDAEPLLVSGGWNKSDMLVVLNPAGSFPSRNWPVEQYVLFAKLWLQEISINTQFVLLLLPGMKAKADLISRELGKSCIDLTGKANQAEAFAILQRCSFVLSEDGGLMHMAWVQGIPTIALFSSSRKDWAAPQGTWSHCFDSSDLECGPCNLWVCKYGDNRCLTRHQPHLVLQKAKTLLKH
jgi:ADP-heptose:LPS heptosyltransferase